MIGAWLSFRLALVVLVALVARAGAQFPFPVGALSVGAHGPPAHLSVPMHAPLQVRPPQMPVVVMPYRSRAADKIFKKKKRRRPEYYSDESSSESQSSGDDVSSSSEFHFRGSKGRRARRKKKREVLTPVISYMTRNGRIVYQKKIKKDDPSDWLQLAGGGAGDGDEGNEGGLTVRDLRRKYGLRRRRRGRGRSAQRL